MGPRALSKSLEVTAAAPARPQRLHPDPETFGDLARQPLACLAIRAGQCEARRDTV